MKRVLVSGATAVTLLALATAAPAADLQSYTADGQVLNILPPGSNGNVDVPALASLGVTKLPTALSNPQGAQSALLTATPTSPAHFADQLEMYDALGKVAPGTLSESSLTSYYKNARLGVADADVVSTETPRAGLTIKRDKFGVPHIKGVTDEDVAFGAGYANIEDRMFLTDVLRHTGSAHMAEFLGPTAANVAMDASQLRIAAYTPAEASQQIADVVKRYPVEGQKLLSRLDAMIAGMNAAQKALCPAAVPVPNPGATGLGFGQKCPVEYAALQKAPTDYTRADIVYIASLVGGIFGKGGGGEEANARWLQQLQAKLGVAAGRKVFDDLREKNDAEAPTTSPTVQPFGGGPVKPLAGNALPDLTPSATAPGTGSDAGGSSVPIPLPAAPDAVDGPFGKIGLGLHEHGLSNALLVDAKHSKDGHPTVVFGPQTGYYTPQLLVEQDLDGPSIKARGVSFAGTNLVVELGHGVDYAWSATSASNDIVDTVVERLCNADGSAATVQSTSYLVGKTCTPMEQYTHTETANPNVSSGPALPQTVNLLVLKTRHGIVQGRTTVGGKPVAIVTSRTTFGHEVDSAVGFARLQDPAYVKDATTFQKAADGIDYTFNWFYTDDRDIAYYCSALLPKRSSGWDWDLPRWGDLAYDDRGSLPFSAHPRAINPKQGYLVSWNNKPAPGFSAADNHWGYGSVYRSLALEDRIKGKTGMTRPKLVEAMIDGGTVDIRAAYLLPEVLAVVGTPTDPQDAKAVALLKAWVAAAGHRVDRARTGSYGNQAAIALLDGWWDPVASGVGGTASLPRDVLRPALGDLVTALPQGLDDHPRQGIGSAFNDVAWYGYVDKDLRHTLGRKVLSPYSRSYCGALAACRAALRASLHSAVQAVLAKQSKTDVSALTYDKSTDFIRHTTAGVVGVRGIDWQNRPTFQQAVKLTAHRPRGAVATPRPVVTPTPVQLPVTGLVATLPLLGLLAVGATRWWRRRAVS